MTVIDRRIDELTPYAKNAKKHDATQVKNLAESIKKYGFKVPVIIDKDGVIVSGHGRVLAAKKLKMKEVPCVIADDLTPEEINAFRLVDNKSAESEWDFDLLAEELPGLNLSDFDFDWGIGIDEEPHEITEDEVPQTAPARCERGDIWILGDHRLMCGDSTNSDEIEKLLDGHQIDLVLTDPPYGINIVKKGKIGAGRLAKNQTYRPVKGDSTTDTARDSYATWTAAGADKSIVFGGNYFTDFLPFSDGWIIWDKRGQDESSNNFADGEMAWCSFHTPVRIYHQIWNGMIREGEHEKRVHPTQKPVRILANIINDFSKLGQNILDCFGGSGSTLMACEQTGRNCFMMEYEPDYCDVIIKRWEDFTGNKAVKLSGKDTENV